MKLTFSVAPTYSFENRPSTDGAFFSGSGLLANAAITSPILKYQDENGNYPISVTTPGITSVDTPNWVRSIRDIKNRRTIKRLLANTSLEVKPIEGMLLKTSLGTDIGSEYHFTFQPSTAGRAFAAAPSASMPTYLMPTTDITPGCGKIQPLTPRHSEIISWIF